MFFFVDVNLIYAPISQTIIEDEKRENTLTIISGTFSLDEGDPLDNVTTLSLSELIKSKGKDAPEASIPGKGAETAQISTKDEKPIKVSPKTKKSVKTKISEN